MAPHKEIVFYSCIINRRDSLKPLQVKEGFRYVLFTDDPHLKSNEWEVRPPVWTDADPVRTSRYHKHNPFDLFPQAEHAIWLDMTHWAYRSLQPLINQADLTLHRHQDRQTAKAEAEKCAEVKFDSPDILKAQVEYYRREGFPDNVGLYASSCMIMRNTYEYRKLSELWWSEICKWSRRDQVSLPYCLWRLGMKPGIIPGVDRNGYSPYFKFKSHYK